MCNYNPNLVKFSKNRKAIYQCSYSYWKCLDVAEVSHAVQYRAWDLNNTSIASVGTRERIAKIRLSKCQILKFLWNLENLQNWI